METVLDSEDPSAELSKNQWATLLGVSWRTIDRWVPVGTPGRRYADAMGQNGEVRITRAAIEAALAVKGKSLLTALDKV